MPPGPLEQRALVLAPGDGSGRRPLLAAETGLACGSARWRAGGWWWARPVLAVHEQEDEPLLFTVRRCWLPGTRHEVRDAEGRRVGYLRGEWVCDPLGRRLAVRRPGGPPGAWVFRSPGGRPLAELAPGGAGARLSFAAEAVNPFTRMLLLASALYATEG
jgi:hypothetical protein